MALPKEVRIYQSPSVRWGAKVMLELPVAEARELYSWLGKLDTQYMNDPQYMYFTSFKQALFDACTPDSDGS
jgi:hypothetical protein